MARQHAGDVQYRAVLAITHPARTLPTGKEWPEVTHHKVIGPYPQKATADAQITRAKRAFSRALVIGHVEVGKVTWEQVP